MKYQATVSRDQPLDINPFPGLRSYQADEADRFFGRHHQVRELQVRLRRSRFLAVVGTSGSGKSSLVRAGLLPRLVRDQSADWHTVVVTPADEPISRLARRIAYSSLHASSPVEAGERSMMIEASLRRGSLGLVEAVEQAGAGGRVVVVVDQFEELFRIRRAEHGEGAEEEAAAYVRLLLEAAAQSSQTICVVLTMRADYLGDCARFAGLPEAINKGQYLVPRLTRENRREVIAGPVELGEATVAPRLLHRLLNDVGDNPDQLPILQHAMMRTWEHWHRRDKPDVPIDLEDYEAIGTMAHALENHAEETLAALDEPGQRLAERLFKRLTEKGADNRETRHPSRVDDVCAAAGAGPAQMHKTIDHFRTSTCSFVQPGLEEPLDDDLLLDISHESLIRVWGRLRRWVDHEAADGAAYGELANRAEGYLGPTKTEDVLTGRTLQHFEEWRRRVEPNEAWSRRYPGDFARAMEYLEISAREHARREAEQRAAAAREARLNRLLARAAWVLLALAVLAGGAALYALKQRDEAEGAMALAMQEQKRAVRSAEEAEAATASAVRSAEEAEAATASALESANVATARQLAMAAQSAVFEDPELGVLLALHAVNQTYPVEVIEATSALNRVLQVLRGQTLITRFDVGAASAALSADGSHVVAISRNGAIDTVALEPEETRKRLCAGNVRTPGGRCGFLTTAAGISADLGTTALGANDGSIAVLRPGADRPPVAHVEQAHDGPVSALAVDAGGTRLVSADRHGRVLLDRIEPDGLHRVAELTGLGAAVTVLALDDSGSWLLAGDADGSARLWQLEECESAVAQGAQACAHDVTLEGHAGAVTSAAFGPGASPLLAATGDVDGNVLVWEPQAAQAPIAGLDGLDSTISVLAFAADPARPRLAVGTWAGQVGLWERAAGEGLRFMIDSARFSDRGASVLAHTVGVTTLAFDADGEQLASGSSGARVKIWEVESGKRTATLRVQGGWVTALAFADSGSRLLSADDAGRVVVWRTPGADSDAAESRTHWKRDVLVTTLEDEERLVASIAGGDLALLRMDSEGKMKLRQEIVSQASVKQMLMRDEPTRIVTRGDDGSELEYILDQEVLIDTAMGHISRELDPAECRRYLYRSECPLPEQWWETSR